MTKTGKPPEQHEGPHSTGATDSPDVEALANELCRGKGKPEEETSEQKTAELPLKQD